MDERSRLIQRDAYEQAVSDIDAILFDRPSVPELRQLLFYAWVQGACWGLPRGIREGQLTAEAVIREMRRRPPTE